MRHRTRDTITAGLALFAMFLGAGNIIFPPFLGAQTGSMWWLATLGFVITGTGLPLLGVLAVSKAGGTADAISERVSPGFAKVFNTLILIFIGPLFAIPRTAATTVELSMLPYLPQFDHKTLLYVGGGLFFLICLGFAISENNAIDRLGKYLTPILAFFMFALIIISIVKPAGRPVAPVIQRNFFYHGFTTGYQTMDGMGSIILGGTVALTLMTKGYKDRELERSLNWVALIAGLGLGAVYVGFAWIGASGSGMLQGIENHTELTVAAVNNLAGMTGQILLSAIIFFACMTTATGLIVTFAEYFKTLLNGRLSYQALAVIVTILAYLVSTLGVESIIKLAAPILEVMYPVVIVLIILNMLGKRVKHRKAFQGAVFATLAISAIMALTFVPRTSELATGVLKMIPLGKEGFPYLIPAALGLLVGGLIEKKADAKEKLTTKSASDDTGA